MLNAAQIDQYRREGFTVAQAFFSAAAVTVFLGEIERVCADQTLSNHDKKRVEMEPKQPADGALVRRIYEPCSYYPVFRELSEDAKLLDCVEPLIGPNLSFHYSKINMKPPAIGSVVEWHQDLLYYPLTNTDSLAALIYLDSADRSNGCLQVIPGGHLAPPLDHTRDGFFQGCVTEPVDLSKAVALEGDAGTVIFMHCLTPHSSVTNTSNRPRRTLILSYRAADTFPIYTGEMTAGAESHVRQVRGQASRFARFSLERFPIPRYAARVSSLYELQERSRAQLKAVRT